MCTQPDVVDTFSCKKTCTGILSGGKAPPVSKAAAECEGEFSKFTRGNFKVQKTRVITCCMEKCGGTANADCRCECQGNFGLECKSDLSFLQDIVAKSKNQIKSNEDAPKEDMKLKQTVQHHASPPPEGEAQAQKCSEKFNRGNLEQHK